MLFTDAPFEVQGSQKSPSLLQTFMLQICKKRQKKGQKKGSGGGVVVMF